MKKHLKGMRFLIIVMIWFACGSNLLFARTRLELKNSFQGKEDIPVTTETLSTTLPMEEDTLTIVERDTIQVATDSLAILADSSSILQDSSKLIGADSITLKDSLLRAEKMLPYDPIAHSTFRPKEDKALWYAALIPGLGQIYNRKYWKLPIVFGAIIGLTYGIAWNADMYSQYGTAYRDLKSGDPNAKSYMNLYAPGTKESDINKSQLETTLKNNRDYYKNNRDLCIILIIVTYGLTVLDAYVDSALFYFDVSPNLAMEVSPKVLQVGKDTKDMSVGFSCTFTF
ncbi:MAG TPA: hypothetical protein DDY68_02075 [Porphyromonadaceae bacterium]|nr:hypothetical protein [Porphyromonadaceae bacterium]